MQMNIRCTKGQSTNLLASDLLRNRRIANESSGRRQWFVMPFQRFGLNYKNFLRHIKNPIKLLVDFWVMALLVFCLNECFSVRSIEIDTETDLFSAVAYLKCPMLLSPKFILVVIGVAQRISRVAEQQTMVATELFEVKRLKQVEQRIRINGIDRMMKKWTFVVLRHALSFCSILLIKY